MRSDTSFSDRKLTVDEFADKYWLNGEWPYQYHSGTIEDGRDEREQFIFNNIRALYETAKFDRSHRYQVEADMQWKFDKLKGKIALMLLANVIFDVTVIAWLIMYKFV